MKKNVLITGATSGIGKATAEVFAKNGYNLILTYNINQNLIQKLKEELENKYKINIEGFQCNIGIETDVINLYENIKKMNCKIDVLVNNAGISNDLPFEIKTVEDFKKIIDINLTGTFTVTKYISRLMNKGSIINISSTNAIDTYYPESIDYDASKAGIISLTHNFAKLFSPKIRVNAICPGWVNTPHNALLNNKQIKTIKKNILLKRIGEPREIADVIFFVANDATYINNSVIRVDGGELC